MSLDVDVERRLGAFRIKAAFASDGGVTALFGRSGAGKTSLVNMIAGLLRPDRGRIAVNGRILFDSRRGIDLPARRRRVGYVFQEARLFPHLTVRQNLFYGRWFTLPAERTIAPGQVIELLGIEGLLKRRPGALSGGEKQRVALGRALLASPRLLLMDEPLASLDAARKGEILPYLERLRDEMRLPVVYVSHVIEEVVRLATTLVVLSEGRVAAVGPVEHIMARLDLHPITGRYEAGAVIEAHVLAHDEAFDLTLLEFAGGRLQVPRLEQAPGSTVRVRIRARDVALALQPPVEVSIRNVIAGRVVEVVEEPGPFAELRIDAAGSTLLARVTRLSLRELGLKPGCRVYALVKSIAIDRHSLGLAATAPGRRPPPAGSIPGGSPEYF